jgi:hypothetical protein
MSTKVVHLSAEAHAQARLHCQKHNLKMSHWVAGLIAHGCAQEDDAAWVSRKVLPRMAEPEAEPHAAGNGPAFAAPPFWADGPST